MNFANFNQDASCISVGLAKGYAVYNCNPFGKCYSANNGAIGEAEMLFSTSLVVLVGRGDHPGQSPRRLKVVNTKRDLVICELTFPTAILKVKLNRARMAVVLEDEIYVYNILNMKLLHTLETAPNSDGVADLSTATDSALLAYPSGPPAKHTLAANGKISPTGEVTLMDLFTLAPLNVVRAHRSPLACLQLNQDGTLLATASEKGTIVRIFSVPSGTLLHEFRRGTYPSKVFSIAFNLASTMIAVSSATETVHIYRLSDSQGPPSKSQPTIEGSDELSPPPTSADSEITPSEAPPSPPPPSSVEQPKEPKKRGYAASLRRKVGRAQKLLPAAVSDMWESKTRDFAWFKLPQQHGTASVVAMAPLSNLIFVATGDGSFIHYSLNIEKGGECLRVAEYSLID